MVTEGIETALSVMQVMNVTAWAALSAIGIANLQLPSTVREVTICVDGDHVSEQAAAQASGVGCCKAGKFVSRDHHRTKISTIC